MYKKILCIITLCMLCIGSITYADNLEMNTLSVYLDDTINLKTYLSEQNIRFDDHTMFQITDTSVLSVNESFMLKAISIGDSAIVIVNGNTLTTIPIHVKSPIKTIKHSDEELVLLLGEIYPFDYKVIGNNDYYKFISQDLKWSSSKQNIVGIKGNNKIYTYAVGTTTLTATAIDGVTSFTMDVTVVGNFDKLTIKPDIVDASVKVGEQRRLRAFFGDKEVTDKVHWESEYPSIMTIDESGLVSPIHEGTCTITAKTSIGRKESYTFFVKSMVDKITFDRTSIIFDAVGDQQQIYANLNYKDPDTAALLDGYYYESLNPNVATVTSDGLITATGKGITLVNAITYDSGKKASCTIEVVGQAPPTTIDYVPAEEIILTPYTAPILVGQKILLDYDIYPQNASDHSVRFNIKNGSITQIQEIDGHYYFIPAEHGSVDIEIVGDNNTSDTIEVNVISQIGNLELDLDNDRGSKTEKRLYIGERAEVLTNIITQGHYSDYDVYPNILDYTVDDPDILKLENIAGKYYVTAHKKGTTSIRVENIEGKYQDALKIRVSSPVSKLTTNREVRLPLEQYYTPEVTYTPTASASTNESFNIYNALKLEVEEFYFDESYIDQEITYENNLIDEFRRMPYSEITEANIQRHIQRLNRLSKLKEYASKGFCLVDNNFLKDRNFESYRYYTIDDNRIIGHYPGKAKINIIIDGTSTKTSNMLYWQSIPEDFAIKAINQWTDYMTLLKTKDFYEAFKQLPTNEQVQLAIYYESNKYRFPSEPSLDLLASLSDINGSTLLKPLFYNFNALTTKEDLAKIAMYLDSKYKKTPPVKVDNVVYYDVIDSDIKQAIALGYVTADSDNYLGITTVITYSDFKSMVDQILPENELKSTFNQPLTHEQILLLLNHL